MNWNDEEDFDDLTPEENAEFEAKMREEERIIQQHPLMKKARSLFQLVEGVVELLPAEEKEMFGNLLIEDVMVINAKLAGAINSGMWQICMQNAAIIRSHAEHLRLAHHSLRIYAGIEEQYEKLMRTEMEEFRELFIEWVKSFDQLEDEFGDEWGLFKKHS